MDTQSSKPNCKIMARCENFVNSVEQLQIMENEIQMVYRYTLVFPIAYIEERRDIHSR